MKRKNIDISDNKNVIIRFFKEHGIDNPLAEYIHLKELIPEGDIESVLKNENLSLENYLKKREMGVPVEYIINRTLFRNRIFYCDYGALIPRLETELLVEKTLDLIKDNFPEQEEIHLLDVGIGCGNISISIALESERFVITGSDISSEALDISRKNLKKFGLNERVKLVKSDLFSTIEKGKKFHVIVCNPPYIPSNLLKNLHTSIIDHEPPVALDAGHFGLDIFLRLIRESPKYLKVGGFLALEVGEGQDKMITRLLRKDGNYGNVALYKYNEVVRIIIANIKS